MILITGATGHIGKELIPLLLETGQEMLASLRKNEGTIITGTVQQITGNPPRTFDAWCCEHLEAFQSEPQSPVYSPSQGHADSSDRAIR